MRMMRVMQCNEMSDMACTVCHSFKALQLDLARIIIKLTIVFSSVFHLRCVHSSLKELQEVFFLFKQISKEVIFDLFLCNFSSWSQL